MFLLKNNKKFHYDHGSGLPSRTACFLYDKKELPRMRQFAKAQTPVIFYVYSIRFRIPALLFLFGSAMFRDVFCTQPLGGWFRIRLPLSAHSVRRIGSG